MSAIRRLVPAAIRRRYAVKFAIVLLLLGLTIGGIGFVATGAITDEVEDRVHDERATTVEHEAEKLEQWHGQNVQTIYSMTVSDSLETDDSAAIEADLETWSEDFDAYAVSYVDTEDETVLASTVDEYSGESADVLEAVTEEGYDEATASGGHEDRTWVSDPYLSDAASDDAVPVVDYVLGPSAVDDRVVVLTVELDTYADQVGGEEHVTTMVLDGNDEVLFDSIQYGDDYETFGLEYGNTSLLETARTTGTTTDHVEGTPSGALGADAYGFDDDEHVVSATSVSGTDWTVTTHEPESQAYGFVHTVNDWGHIATAFGVLMIGLLGAVIGRNTATSIDRLTEKADKIEQGDLDVDLETDRIDNIGRLYQGLDSMRDSLREQIEEAETARAEAERERERIEEINDSLEQTADEYSDVMVAAADGDLTVRMDTDADNEAMAEIAEEFNGMLAEIEETVAELNRFATDVATASEQVTASSEEVRSASQQVTESIQEISDGAERQNESLQSVNQEMSSLSTTTEEIAASSNEVADIAERTVETGQDGQEAARDAITAMDEIEAEADDAVAEIRRLEQEVQQIDELINTISEIARQTNMLALNANIEASRSASGNDDEGFSVVAKEVKALSEDVEKAAEEAEERLEAIRERTEQSAAEVEGTSGQIENASQQVTDAVEALEEIADLAQETNVGVQEISAATEEQAASTQEVVAMVDDAATVSEETTAEAENVAAAAEEQTTAMTEVTHSASELSGQAGELSAALDRFETDADPESLAIDFDTDGDDDPDAPLTAPSAGMTDGLESTTDDESVAASAPETESESTFGDAADDGLEAEDILGIDDEESGGPMSAPEPDGTDDAALEGDGVDGENDTGDENDEDVFTFGDPDETGSDE
ncbi:methyl-accepting chemotaxis protein [Natronolimnohabitans sp. A-GB9]|uniref:methyl-accepting chemotaxis protein n=1 Tax=Natronolimnohabitans sp. A-GB9 TaxID=3069757 RepID=UPI0027AF61F9|nr:methyl-accepting chemotaxis protein [Natronolimnohabitans sp. A-GB9]MDQ2050501.1 methyl-accepting chemotaxis protein [Natronolimnohabitans sp. A-GB9]